MSITIIRTMAVNASLISFPTNPVILPAGQLSTSFIAIGTGTGNTTIIANSALGSAYSIVFISEAVSGMALSALTSVVGMQINSPKKLGTVYLGSNIQKTIPFQFLDFSSPNPTNFSVHSNNENVARIPPEVTVGPGEKNVPVIITTEMSGEVSILFRSEFTSRELRVLVGTAIVNNLPQFFAQPAGIKVQHSRSLGQVIVPENSNHGISLTLMSVPATSDTILQSFSSDTSVVEIVGNVVVNAGDRGTEVNLVSRNEGIAIINLSTPLESQELVIIVGDPLPEEVPLTLAPIVEVEVEP